MRSSVSVVIVSQNGRGLLAPCLAALYAGTRIPDEVIIVDNASTDSTRSWLVQTYPDSIVIPTTVNTGFAAANNIGIRRASGTYLFTLNNDTEIAPNALAALVATLDDAGEHVGAAMSTMVFLHHPPIVQCMGLVVSQDGVVREARTGERHDPHESSYPVFGPSAGAALYRRSALDDVGLFDPAFFAYLEDADLAWRLRLRGWETLAVPAATVLHHYSATGGYGSPRKSYYLARNRWWCMLKNMPDALLQKYAPQIARYDAAAVVFATLTGDRANIAGRATALREASFIRAARQRTQSRATARNDAIAAWLTPPQPFADLLRERRKIAALLNS